MSSSVSWNDDELAVTELGAEAAAATNVARRQGAVSRGIVGDGVGLDVGWAGAELLTTF